MKPRVWASVLHQTSGYWTFSWLSWLMSTCLMLNVSVTLLLKEGKMWGMLLSILYLVMLDKLPKIFYPIIKLSTKGRLSPHSMKADLWKPHQLLSLVRRFGSQLGTFSIFCNPSIKSKGERSLPLVWWEYNFSSNQENCINIS